MPYGFTGAMAGEIDLQTSGASTFAIPLVRAQAKQEPPLRNLRVIAGITTNRLPGASITPVVTMIAEITIFGHTFANEKVSATGRATVDFVGGPLRHAVSEDAMNPCDFGVPRAGAGWPSAFPRGSLCLSGAARPTRSTSPTQRAVRARDLLVLSVSKDILVADGRDFAVVTATVRGPDGGRVAQNQDVFFAIADESGRFADIGVIVGSNGPGTGATVRTNAQGVAQVLYEAPARTDATANQTVLVLARLVGSDFNGDTYHPVRIELRSAEPRLFPANPTNALPKCNFITEPAAGPFRTNQVIGFHSTGPTRTA